MSKSIYSLIFSTCILLILIWAAVEAKSFQEIASYFPLYIALFSILLIVIDIIFQLVKLKKNKNSEDKVGMQIAGPVLKYILWFVSYLLMIFLFGFLIATAIFLLAFLLLESKLRIVMAISAVAVTIIMIIFLGETMDLIWPIGIFGI